MKTPLFALMAALLLLSCKPEPDTAPNGEVLAAQLEADRAEALAAIEKANTEINRLVRAGEFEAAGAYFAEDVVQMISGQPPIMSREAWMEAQRQAAAMGEWNLDLEVLNFAYLGDAAVERGRGIQSFIANENSPIPSMEMTGEYMVYWVRSGDGWQIQYDYVVLQQPETAAEGM